MTLDQGTDGKWQDCRIGNLPDETVAAVSLV